MEVRLTHSGGPTVLIEVGGWRLLTDPTFDSPGRRYAFGWGTSSRKLNGPTIAAAELPAIDADSDCKTGLAERYGGEPLLIQVRKRSTSSAGQGPSQGMLPAASFS